MEKLSNLEKPTERVSSRKGARLYGLAVFMTLVFVACASAPPTPVEPAPAPPPPSTEVYFYPTKGQSAAQQDRDRYECYLWAKKQTGFDPSAPGLAPHQRVRVIPTAPPGSDTAAGAVTGAVIGAVVSPPSRSAEGAAVGAIAGAVLGAASDASRQEQAERVQQHYDQQQVRRMARLEQQADSYRRAMAACLEGRGYTVH
jgi:hypothetical protein